jgi:AcrR family transcriptional regulator
MTEPSEPTEQEATRERLVDATIDLLNRGGNHSLRLADVAKETGVAISTIYAHFRDRTDLVATARLRQFREHADQALQFVDAGLDRDDVTDLAALVFWPSLRSPDDPSARARRWDRIEAIADARHIPELAEQLEELQVRLTRRTTELAGRAQERGLIDPTLDPAALALLTQVLRLGLALWDLSGDARPTPEAWLQLMERVAVAVTTGRPEEALPEGFLPPAAPADDTAGSGPAAGQPRS